MKRLFGYITIACLTAAICFSIPSTNAQVQRPTEGGKGTDRQAVQQRSMTLFQRPAFTWDERAEHAGWHCDWQIEKWENEKDFRAHKPSYATAFYRGNILLNAGIQRMEDLLIGAGGQALDNTHARIGAGDGTTAVAATDTDLSAAAGSTHRWFQTMDSTFPSRSSQTLTFKATFGASDGNFAWGEFGIDAGTASGNTVTAPLLNRKLSSPGTKASPAVWTMTATIAIS